jgi:hypothetical protein
MPSTTIPGGCSTVVDLPSMDFVGSTLGRANTMLLACAGADPASGGEIIYRWIPAVSGVHIIETCDMVRTTFDTVLALRGATCAGANLACNDDIAGCGTTTDVANPHRGSRLTVTVTAGSTYHLVVDGFGQYGLGSGAFRLRILPPITPTPSTIAPSTTSSTVTTTSTTETSTSTTETTSSTSTTETTSTTSTVTTTSTTTTRPPQPKAVAVEVLDDRSLRLAPGSEVLPGTILTLPTVEPNAP